MLQPGEEILLEAEGQGIVGLLRPMGPGCAYLTSQRIIWLRREDLIFRCLWWMLLVPSAISISIADIRNVIRGGPLLVVTDKQRFSLRLRQGLFSWSRYDAAITDEWFEAIQRLRSGGSSSADLDGKE